MNGALQRRGENDVAALSQTKQPLGRLLIGVQRTQIVIGPPIAESATIDSHTAIGVWLAVPDDDNRSDPRSQTAI